MSEWGADARYTRIVEQHGTLLLRLAVLVTGSRHDAEDVVQDAILSVAARWNGAAPQFGLAYLKKAVTNRALDVVRRRREHPTDELPDRAHDDAGFLRFEQDRAFFRMLDDLPEGQRMTLILRFYADLDDRAIAKTLGISVQTVRSQASRAIAKLRASIAPIEIPTDAAAASPHSATTEGRA